MTSPSGGRPIPAAAGADEAWRVTLDALMRGVAHGISNRVGTLGALAEALAAADPTGPFPPILAEEVHRLEEALRVLRLLPRDEGRGVEPLRPVDAAADAAALFEQHPRGRGTRAAVSERGDVPPIRAHVPSLVHALALLMVAAAGEAGAPVSITLAGEGGRVQFRVARAGSGADLGDVDGAVAAASALVRGDGGSVARDDDGSLVLSLPSLAAVRGRP